MALGLPSIAGAAPPQIESFQSSGPQGHALELRGRVPTNSIVTLQVNAKLVEGAWLDASPPVLALAAGEATFEVPYESAAGGFFFRLKAESYDLPLQDDGSQFKLVTTTPVPFGLLLEAVSRATGQNLYPVDPACADPFRLIGPLNLSAVNAKRGILRSDLTIW